MSTPAHTAGPWSIAPGMPCCVWTDSVPTGRGVAVTAMNARSADEQIANALLISAAPDLLDVVKRLLREDEADEFTIGLIEDARAALKKARGDE